MASAPPEIVPMFPGNKITGRSVFCFIPSTVWSNSSFWAAIEPPTTIASAPASAVAFAALTARATEGWSTGSMTLIKSAPSSSLFL